MKRILSLVLFLLLASVSTSYATRATATFGDKNSSNVYRLTSYSDQTGSNNYGWLTYASDTGIVYPYQIYSTVGNSSTTLHQLITKDSGTTVVDMGGVASTTSASGTKGFGTTHVLPPCSATQSLGNVYTVIAGSRSTITLDVYSTSDAFLKSISGTGFTGGEKFVSTGQAGDTLQVQCVAANLWAVVDETAAWTDGG